MKTRSFFQRVRSQEKNSDTTWINPFLKSGFNSAMITLYAYGESVFQPGFRRKAFTMRYWALEYVCEGMLQIDCDGEKFRLKQGDILLLAPGKSYACSTLGEKPVKKKEIMLNNSPLISILCNRSSLNGRTIIHCKDPVSVHAYFTTVQQIVSVSPCDNRSNKKIGDTAFALLNELVYQCQSPSIYESFPELLASFDTFSPDMNLEKMAAHFHVEKRTLNRIFHKHLGCSPGQHLISCRMKYASQLLRDNTLSVKAVAEECGYRNASFFSAEFKKYFGLKPLEFRNRNNGKK